jgi:tetratricopeptide (TPR) repeat protein
MFKPGLRFGLSFSVLLVASGSPIAGRVMAAPLQAQGAGQAASRQDDQIGTLAEYQKELAAYPNSSLVNYRIAELHFRQHDWQASANAYRDALRGDGEPDWTKVWSDVQLGKIFDITGQRDRAVMQYQLAVRTNDNTRGALDEAQKYLQTPYRLTDAP